MEQLTINKNINNCIDEIYQSWRRLNIIDPERETLENEVKYEIIKYCYSNDLKSEGMNFAGSVFFQEYLNNDTIEINWDFRDLVDLIRSDTENIDKEICEIVEYYNILFHSEILKLN
jgi:hypothetical protein